MKPPGSRGRAQGPDITLGARMGCRASWAELVLTDVCLGDGVHMDTGYVWAPGHPQPWGALSVGQETGPASSTEPQP